MSEPYSSLSLSQRAYVNSQSLKAASKWLLILVSCITFFSALALAALLFSNTQNIIVLVGGVVISFILSVYVIIWFIIKVPHAYRRLTEWNEDYLHSAYILIFDTTLPKGDSSGKRLLNLARMVFPELRPEVYYSALLDKPSTQVFTKSLWNKLRQSKDPETGAKFDQRVDSQNLDVIYDTGKGYFIIKDFKDQVVTSDKLKTFLEMISKHFSKIFRVIVVAKEYESKLTGETLEEQMSKLSGEKFPYDLIVEEKLGYSVLWIGEN
jgi:hypothetical protein